ncbi:MAG: gliding motility-associated C-terminal domain-containing protein [Crocinitomicaceae bacterium]|jgi:gliding motility-associated-like protein|nr:gliding motility-associated C-terminal domain-containing protein [Crocinitomicaceae bacterium]
MKFRLTLVAGISLLFSSAFSQVTTCLGNDVTVCQGQSVTINNCPTASGSGLFLNAPNSVSLGDDSWSAAINMGFNFSYYGQTYSQCIIGSNGIVSFNTGNAGGGCAWSLNGTPIPTGTMAAALNSAMGCYQDLNPANANSGPVQYQTIGTAPNRAFVVLYNGVTMFSCTQSCAYIAFIFRETSNEVEYHIGYKGSCPSWNSGLAIQGVQNAPGALGVATPGRNNTVWTANQDARKFTPLSPTNTLGYTVSTIPYVTVSAPSGNLQWKSNLGQTFPYNNGQLVVNQVPPGTTGYFLVGTSCGVSVGTVSDTTFVTRVNASVSVTGSPAVCGSNTGTAVATPSSGSAPYTFTWPTLGQTGDSVSNLAPGSYAVVMTDGNGCNASGTVTIQSIQANLSGDSTQVSCTGGSDGTATAYISPMGSNTTYLWDDPLAQTTQTATGLSAGTYNCIVTSDNGCSGTVTVIVDEIPGLQANIVNQQDVTCYTMNDGIIEVQANQGTAPYTYSWTGSSSGSNLANDLYAGNQDVTITDANGCVITLNTILDEPDPLQIDFISNDTMICSESAITISVSGSGGSSPYTYTWFENGTSIGTGSSILVDPLNSGTTYHAVLSEACGSPTTADTLEIIFPTPIIPLIDPDKPVGCAPDRFTFFNNSTNSSEIANTYYEISNGDEFLLNGIDTIYSYFPTPGTYNLDVVITSIYGCIYEESFPGIITALQRPVARFSTSANPITIFETSVQLNSKSVDAVAWEWSIPNASPATGNTETIKVDFPSTEGNYPMTLKVTSAEGCTDSTTVIMIVESDLILYAPTAFTPDGDQHNQTWKFVTAGLDISEFEMSVYDRWGALLWQSNDPTAEWDGTFNGKLLPQGTYSWACKIQEVTKENPRILYGNVLIIR